VKTSLLSEFAIVITSAKIGGKCDKMCVQKERRGSGSICGQRFPRFVYKTTTISHFFLSNPVDSRGKVTTNATNKRSDCM